MCGEPEPRCSVSQVAAWERELVEPHILFHLLDPGRTFSAERLYLSHQSYRWNRCLRPRPLHCRHSQRQEGDHPCRATAMFRVASRAAGGAGSCWPLVYCCSSSHWLRASSLIPDFVTGSQGGSCPIFAAQSISAMPLPAGFPRSCCATWRCVTRMASPSLLPQSLKPIAPCCS